VERNRIMARLCAHQLTALLTAVLTDELLPAGLDENGSASFAEDGSACLHADAKRRRLMTAVTDRRAPKCFLWNSG
jgi:hypothetical protein